MDVFFLATFCFTCFETTIGLLVCQKFSIAVESERATTLQGYMFAYAGIIGFLAQCGTGSLVKSLGEPKLIAINLFLVAISLAAALPFFASWVLLYFLLTLLAIGSSLIRPPAVFAA